MKKVTFLIIGGGNRGKQYSRYIENNPDTAKVIGIANPGKKNRNYFVNKFDIKPEFTFTDWKQAAEKDKFADAVIISTQDQLHEEPAVAFAKKGYHILLEKPMTNTLEGCKRIYDTAKGKNIILGLCHVLRYTPFTQKLKEIINSGAIGDIIGLVRIEPIGHWHYTHSYVRGNWNKEENSSFILMAKSCHDIDWIQYIIGKKCKTVSSFGSLKFFKKENKPRGASDRCLNCKIEKTCPYSAKSFYLNEFEKGNHNWPVNVITSNFTKSAVKKALQEGPYGRCVFVCDNNVMDNQIVNIQFEDESTASFIMTAFTEAGGRRTTIFGTKGEIYGDGNDIKVYDFLTGKTKTHSINLDAYDAGSGGHGGGDFAMMKNFIKAISENKPELVFSNLNDSYESYKLTFNAEKSRKEGRVICST